MHAPYWSKISCTIILFFSHEMNTTFIRLDFFALKNEQVARLQRYFVEKTLHRPMKLCNAQQ